MALILNFYLLQYFYAKFSGFCSLGLPCIDEFLLTFLLLQFFSFLLGTLNEPEKLVDGREDYLLLGQNLFLGRIQSILK